MSGKTTTYLPAGMEDSDDDSDDDYYALKNQFMTSTAAPGFTCGFSTGGSSRYKYKYQPPVNQVPVERVLTFEEKLEEALKNGENDKISTLLQSKSSGDVSDFIRIKEAHRTEENERTLIMIAGRHGNFSTINFLLNEMSNLLLIEMKKTTLDKYTELMAIANPQFPDDFSRQIDQDSLIECAKIIINRFLSSGSEHCKLLTIQDFLNLQDKYGRSCLIIAAMNSLDKLVKFFISQGSDVNIADNFFKTALIHASERNSGLIIRYLLEAGADVHVRDIGHKTALDFANENENSTVTDILYYATKTHWRPRLNPVLMEAEITQTPFSDRLQAIKEQEQEQIETILLAEGLETLCGSIFESHSITYMAFLQLDEDDLIEMNITNREDRRKILQVIDSILDRNWNSATVLPIDMQTEFSPSEITCILLDTTQHITRQFHCINQIREGIQRCPAILQKGLEVKQIPHLIQSTEGLKANSQQMSKAGKNWLDMLDELFAKMNRKGVTSKNKRMNGQNPKSKRETKISHQKVWANKVVYLIFGVSLAVGVGFILTKKKDIQYSTLIDHFIPNF